MAEDWKKNLNAIFNPDEIFYSNAERKNGTLDEMEIDQIVPFKRHTFKVVDDDKMMELVESIKDHGVNEPAIVFVNEDGNYEMIAGHRRKRACELAGIETIPIIVKNIDRDEATILMGESNLQTREEILPSEKAFTYKELLEAKKRQAGRPGLKNASPVATNFPKGRAVKELAEEVGEGKDTIRRYIRLTYLIPELLDLVDQKRISLRPAVEISYLDSSLQKAVFNFYTTAKELEGDGSEKQSGVSPSLAQAKAMRESAEKNELNEVKINQILQVKKPNQKEKIVINDEKVMRYGKNLSPLQFQEKILKALAFYEKHMEKEKNKAERAI